MDFKNAEAAKAFIALVRSAEGRKSLTESGFLKPCRPSPGRVGRGKRAW